MTTERLAAFVRLELPANRQALSPALIVPLAWCLKTRLPSSTRRAVPSRWIRCTAEIDATELLAAGDSNTIAYGIQPQLAVLELLVYPSTSELNPNEALTNAGTLEILPMESSLTLFVWSKSRVTPVRITDLDITEEFFDPQLNPIHAKVSIGMRVLNVNDVGFGNPAGSLYMTYQATKETLAALAPRM